MVIKETSRQQAYNRWQKETAAERWRMAKALHDQGMTMRAIAAVMSVTYQRVQKMLSKLAEMERTK